MKKIKFLVLLVGVVFSLSAYAQDSTTIVSKDDCNTYISLYREYFKQWESGKYKAEALSPGMIPAWRNAFLGCPSLRETTYLDGVKIVQYLIRKEKNQAKKDAYIDTLVMVYDRRAEYFPTTKAGKSQIGNIMGRKGVDLLTYAPERYEQAYNALKQSVELDGDKTQCAILDAYFLMTTKMASEGKLDESVVVEAYDQVCSILDVNLNKYKNAANEKQVENYTNVRSNVDGRFEPFAKCEDLVRIFTPKFKADPENVELLSKITGLLDRSNCTSEKLYLDASINLHRLQPSPESAFLIGRLLLLEEKYNEALPYFKEAANSENVDRKESSYKFLARIYSYNKNYSSARDMAYKAIAVDPNDGEAYILIGDMYAATAGDCGNGDFYSKTAYWAAVDKYQKAKQVDPSMADKANERIRAYSAHFPSVETIFFNDFAEGGEFTVECWINEKTTVRAAKN